MDGWRRVSFAIKGALYILCPEVVYRADITMIAIAICGWYRSCKSREPNTFYKAELENSPVLPRQPRGTTFYSDPLLNNSFISYLSILSTNPTISTQIFFLNFLMNEKDFAINLIGKWCTNDELFRVPVNYRFGPHSRRTSVQGVLVGFWHVPTSKHVALIWLGPDFGAFSSKDPIGHPESSAPAGISLLPSHWICESEWIQGW